MVCREEIISQTTILAYIIRWCPLGSVNSSKTLVWSFNFPLKLFLSSFFNQEPPLIESGYFHNLDADIQISPGSGAGIQERNQWSGDLNFSSGSVKYLPWELGLVPYFLGVIFLIYTMTTFLKFMWSGSCKLDLILRLLINSYCHKSLSLSPTFFCYSLKLMSLYLY